MNISAKSKKISLILKTVTAVSAVLGTVLSAIAGGRAFMGGSRVFMYFTIQSNIAIALICAVGALLLVMNKKAGTAGYVIKFAGSVAITLTGIVFCFVLAPTMGLAAWNVQNVLTHVVVPIAAVADFFVVASYGDVKNVHILWTLVPPLAYGIYASIGYVSGWEFSNGVNYPYFFLNWGSDAGAFGFSRGLPFMGCVWWILAILLFILAVGKIYLVLLDSIKRRRAGGRT